MIKILGIVAVVLLQSGCATIISGRHQDVPVISSPHGAKACTSGQCVTTPGSFTLRRDANHIVVVEKDGYLPETVTLTSGVGAAVAGNLIFGGIIGGGIDMASGAAYKLYPETLNVALRQNPGSANAGDLQPTPGTEPQRTTPDALPQPTIRRARLYPTGDVKIGSGSMSGIGISLAAEYIDGDDGRGTARFVYLNNQLLEGSYVTVNPGQSFDGLVSPKLIDSQSVFNYPVSSTRGFASAIGQEGTTIECVYTLRTAERQSGGTCLDNYGNHFRLAF